MHGRSLRCFVLLGFERVSHSMYTTSYRTVPSTTPGNIDCLCCAAGRDGNFAQFTLVFSVPFCVWSVLTSPRERNGTEHG